MEQITIKKGMIDSHFHFLHMEKKGLPAEKILTDCFENGMAGALEIGIVPETFARRAEIAESFPGLYMASGLYPSYCETPEWEKSLILLEDHLRTVPKVVALGEIGLDYFHNYGNKSGQIELFEAQLALADKLSLPVVIHCREAEADTLECLGRIRPSKGGVMHCFSSSSEWVTPFLDLGFFISFAGNVSYKKSDTLRESAKMVPRDRILTETDAPYLGPQPVRGRQNHPGFIGHTYEVLADTRGEILSDLIRIIKSNFEKLISRSL